jgi:hypothetical protein
LSKFSVYGANEISQEYSTDQSGNEKGEKIKRYDMSLTVMRSRAHLGLDKGAPVSRVAEKNPSPGRTIVSTPKLGGYDHRYDLAA